jgi:hypothetical protein
VSQSQGWLALLALLLANLALGFQIEETRRYWEWSMSGAPRKDAEA